MKLSPVFHTGKVQQSSAAVRVLSFTPPPPRLAQLSADGPSAEQTPKDTERTGLFEVVVVVGVDLGRPVQLYIKFGVWRLKTTRSTLGSSINFRLQKVHTHARTVTARHGLSGERGHDSCLADWHITQMSSSTSTTAGDTVDSVQRRYTKCWWRNVRRSNSGCWVGYRIEACRTIQP